MSLNPQTLPCNGHEIQFAGNVQWPLSNPANAGIRGEFKLPPDKAFK